MVPQLRDHARYDILGEHGRGGLGRVARAHDRELGRDIAIKELISRGDVGEVRFLREALITARLEHPGIVPVYEAGRWADGTPFYAMKLVAGRPLRELILERETVDERIGLLHHVIAVADAIAYAHGRNIIHRDLKPSNVIVGDFGETVVIDWGLAKDLSADEEPTLGGGPFRGNREDGLTSTGSVLGTPAYMAPEQERGESVDQRADVYAIGAMLWELCSLQKLPPAYTGQRARILRRSGIDADLVTIVEKAVNPNPAGRYGDAGALAADLKAFKAGARIAARRYSLWALLSHWTRRHRSLASSIGVAIAIVASGGVLYVRSIAGERDRADTALARAESARDVIVDAQRTAETALADQMLKRAELQLSSDPTAALNVLSAYKGADRLQIGLLRAEAHGRGLAKLRATPHTDTISWITGLPDGSIATLATDGTAAVTSPAGATTKIAHDVVPKDVLAYAAKPRMLAYVCNKDQICLVDLSQSPPTVTRLTHFDPDGLSLSPDADKLAAISQARGAIIWNITDRQHPTELQKTNTGGWKISFLDNNSLGIVGFKGYTIWRPNISRTDTDLPGIVAVDASYPRHAFAVGTIFGVAILVQPAPLRVTRYTGKLCEGPLNALRLLPNSSNIAYGCKNGSVGIWYPERGQTKPLSTISGDIDSVDITPDGQYLALGGSAGILTVIDLQTEIASSYLGHNGRISAVAAPSADFSLWASADTNGNIRTWESPVPVARVAFTATSRLMDAQFVSDGLSIVGTSATASLHFETARGGSDVATHAIDNIYVTPSLDSKYFATYGWGGKVEIWETAAQRRLQQIDVGQSVTTQLRFLSFSEFACVGNDGRVLRWSPSRGLSMIADLGQAAITFRVLHPDPRLVVDLVDGSLVVVDLDGKKSRLEVQPETALSLQDSRDSRWLATGNRDGAVVVYNTRTWAASTILRATGTIRHIAFSPSNDMIVVAAQAGPVYIGRIKDDPAPDWNTMHIAWSRFVTHPRYVSFTPTGDLLMIACSDGVVWFYSIIHDHWLYSSSGPADLTIVRPSNDGRLAITADSAGRLLILDLDLVRKLI